MRQADVILIVILPDSGTALAMNFTGPEDKGGFPRHFEAELVDGLVTKLGTLGYTVFVATSFALPTWIAVHGNTTMFRGRQVARKFFAGLTEHKLADLRKFSL